MSDHRTAEYHKAISSQRWRELKERVIVLRGKACEGCGTKRGRLDLHHDTYERLGNERLSDLRILCPDCHRAEDILRAERGVVSGTRKRAEAEVRYYWARVAGCMASRYGEGWEDRFSDDAAADLFDGCGFD